MTGISPRSPRHLSALLADLAAEHPSGTLRVDTFMDAALYDPEGGYYVRAEAIGGQRRDFSTIPSLSPLLGQAVARWALSLPVAQERRSRRCGIGTGRCRSTNFCSSVSSNRSA